MKVLQAICYLPGNHRACWVTSPAHQKKWNSSLPNLKDTSPNTKLFAHANDIFGLSSLSLICKNLNASLDGLFEGLLIINGNTLKILKQTLANAGTIIIFSNDEEEISAVCNKIEELSQKKTAPLIILATSANIDMNALDANIIACIKTNFESEIDVFNFWKKIKKQIDNLMFVTEELTLKSNKRCIMM